MKNKTLLVVVLVGALALYLFWEDLFPSDTQTAPATSEKSSLPELSEKAKALTETVQTARMPVMENLKMEI